MVVAVSGGWKGKRARFAGRRSSWGGVGKQSVQEGPRSICIHTGTYNDKMADNQRILLYI